MAVVKIKLPDGATRLAAGDGQGWRLPMTVPPDDRKPKRWNAFRVSDGTWRLVGHNQVLQETQLGQCKPLDVVLIPDYKALAEGRESGLVAVEILPPSKDPFWRKVTTLPTDYVGYGGQVPEETKADDCSVGCRWARYLEGDGDWLVCANPDGPRLGLLTWEHQAGRGCFEWSCYSCGHGEKSCRCPDGEDAGSPVSDAAADLVDAVLFYRSAQTPAARKHVRGLLRGVSALLNLVGGDVAVALAGPLQSTAAFLDAVESATVPLASEDPP